jgi:hypothetical protein
VLAQQVRGQREAPAREVGHRGLADRGREPPGQRGPGDADVGRELGDRPRLGRLVLQQPQGLPGDRVLVRPVPGRRVGAGPVEPGTQRRDQQQVEQPVEDGFLTRQILADLGGEQPGERGRPVGRAQHEHRRQRAQQPSAQLAGHAVGAGEQHDRPVGVVAPGADPDVGELAQVAAVGGAAFLAGQDERLRRGAGVVGDQVRIRATGDRDVAFAHQDAFAAFGHDPRFAADDRHHGQRRAVLDAQRPRRGQHRTQQERAVRAGAVEERGERVHAEDLRR